VKFAEEVEEIMHTSLKTGDDGTYDPESSENALQTTSQTSNEQYIIPSTSSLPHKLSHPTSSLPCGDWVKRRMQDIYPDKDEVESSTTTSSDALYMHDGKGKAIEFAPERDTTPVRQERVRYGGSGNVFPSLKGVPTYQRGIYEWMDKTP
jgi:hypothetical protein